MPFEINHISIAACAFDEQASFWIEVEICLDDLAADTLSTVDDGLQPSHWMRLRGTVCENDPDRRGSYPRGG